MTYTNTSLPPPSDAMNPKPFVALKHLTCPVVDITGFLLNTGFPAADAMPVASSKSRLIGESVVVTPGHLQVAEQNIPGRWCIARPYERFSESPGLNRRACRIPRDPWHGAPLSAFR